MTKQFKFQGPDGQVHVLEGPDDATDEQAFQILQSQMGGNQPSAAPVQPGSAGGPAQGPDSQLAAQTAAQPQRTGTEQLLRALGLSVRPAAEAAGSTAGMVGDALNGAINLGGMAVNKVGQALGHDPQLPQLGMPSQAISRGIDSVLPKPETGMEKFVNGAATIGYGMAGMDPLANAISKQLPQAAPKVLSPREQTLLDAQKAGYLVPPDQVPGSKFGKLAEAFAGKRQLTQEMQVRNQANTNKLLTKGAGLPEGTPLTPEALKEAMSQTYQDGYEPVAQVGRMTNGGIYRKALDQVLKDYQGASASFPDASNDKVAELVKNYRVPNYDSGDALKAISDLRGNASGLFATDPALAHANKGVANALEGSIDLNLRKSQQPGAEWMLDAYRAARTQLAKQYEVSKALKVGSGDANAQRLAQSLQRGKPLTDELKTVGQFANVAPSLAGIPPTQNPVGGFGHMVGMGIPPIVAGAVFGPHAGVAAAALPVARAGTRALMMSKAGQKMIGPSLNPGIVEQLLGNPKAMRAFPSALEAMGLYGPQEDD
jgi:hypothetical protein